MSVVYAIVCKCCGALEAIFSNESAAKDTLAMMDDNDQLTIREFTVFDTVEAFAASIQTSDGDIVH